MNTLLKQKKDTLEFHKLAVELKKWFEDRNIDTGYTDTNVGHLALLVQKKIKEAREEVNKNELHNKIHKEGFEAGYRKGLKEAGEKIYTKQEVLESIERAFWNGVEEGEIEGAGEYFSAEDYLPDTKQEMGEGRGRPKKNDYGTIEQIQNKLNKLRNDYPEMMIK